MKIGIETIQTPYHNANACRYFTGQFHLTLDLYYPDEQFAN